MLDPAITRFLEERKERWLKGKMKPGLEAQEVKNIEQEGELLFSLSNWVNDNAKKAVSRAISTHPSKFSHPSTGVGKTNVKAGTYVTPVFVEKNYVTDGFLKTGNVRGVASDSVGDAGALPIEEFLMLKLLDGSSILEHLEKMTELSLNFLESISSSPRELCNELLEIKRNDEHQITNSKIKQVYFPVEDGYHLLSVLTNSGMIFELRKRLDSLRFSDEVKELRAKKRNNEYSEQGFYEIYNLTTIGYGGTKPQNISVLNNQNGGKAHLLLSMPPQLEERKIHFPKSDFFKECLRDFEFKEAFSGLHKLLKVEHNNINIRDALDRRWQDIIDQVIRKMWAVRSVADEQYRAGNTDLNRLQKIWLTDEFPEEREEADKWLDKLIKELSVWVIKHYEKAVGKQAIMLGKAERLKALEIIELNREALR